jgi:S1-C subfamily serine protease
MSGTAFTCPKCGTNARSARDIPTGALVKCPNCAHVFRFGEEPAAAEPAPVARRAAPEPEPEPEPRRRADDDYDDDRPRRRRDEDDRVRSRRDDHDDDRPRRRRYDDEDDDRPRRRRGEGGMRIGTGIAFGVVCLLMLIGVVAGVLAYAYRNTGTNEVVMKNPQPPPGLRNPGSMFGEDSFGEFEDTGLNNPADDKAEDKQLTKNAKSLLTDPSLTVDQPHYLVGPSPASAKKTVPGTGSSSLNPDVLARVKAATTFILCKFHDGRAGSGSGFFVGGNHVMTNAHVVGMLPPGSSKPQALDIILNSGLSNEAKCKGEVMIVDHDHDLALVKVSTPDKKKGVKFPPEPLTIAASSTLLETQTVFIFGYPLGERLGKAVTVSQTTVSSFRPEARGMRVQFNGGMDHGNSGGPVVDAAGQVIAVSVAKIPDSQFHFGVATEHVSALLEGHLAMLTAGRVTKKGDKYELAVTVTSRDPLKKITAVAVDWWWGKVDKAVPAQRGKRPADAERKSVDLKAGEDGKYTGTIPLEAQSQEGKVLWLQARHTAEPGKSDEDIAYYEGVAVEVVGAAEAKPVRLAYQPRHASGTLVVRTADTVRFDTHEGGVHTAEVNVAAEMKEERVGKSSHGAWIFRDAFTSLEDHVAFDGHGYDRSTAIGGHKMHVDKARIELQNGEGGKVTAGRSAFGDGVPEDAKHVLTGYTSRVARAVELASVDCPSGEIQPGHTWSDERRLPLLSVPEAGEANLKAKLKYTYTGVRKLDGREVAEVVVSGEAGDLLGDDDAPGKVSGFLLIDVKTGVVAKANVVLDVTQKGRSFHGEPSDVTHTLEVKLQRQ